MDDTTLINRLFVHDRHAVSAFYRRFAPELRRYIGCRVNQPEDADEILQDTLFSFLEGLRDFRKESSVRTYLFSICQHKVIDFYRRRKLKQVVFSQVPQLEMLVSPVLGPEEELDAKLVQEKIRAVFDRLLPDYRQILKLKYLDHVTVEDIARKLTITFKSAESRLFRARRVFVELFLSI